MTAIVNLLAIVGAITCALLAVRLYVTPIVTDIGGGWYRVQYVGCRAFRVKVERLQAVPSVGMTWVSCTDEHGRDRSGYAPGGGSLVAHLCEAHNAAQNRERIGAPPEAP